MFTRLVQVAKAGMLRAHTEKNAMSIIHIILSNKASLSSNCLTFSSTSPFLLSESLHIEEQPVFAEILRSYSRKMPPFERTRILSHTSMRSSVPGR